MATGAIFELGGLLCSLSIALNRENNMKGNLSGRASRAKTSAAIGERSTKFELLSTATDPTEPIFKLLLEQTKAATFGSEKQRGTEFRAYNRTSTTTTKQSVVTENLIL